MNAFEYEDGTVAEIQDDNSVFIRHADGRRVKISGFPTRFDAHNFLCFGDLDTMGSDNDYVVIAKPNFELTWTWL